MRTAALEFLACPRCHGTLFADPQGHSPAGDGHLMTGVLISTCGARFPIEAGIPRLTPDAAELPIDPSTAETAQRFGEEWKIFDHKAEYYEQQFLDWLSPLSPVDFAGKLVLEGGCGKGRHSQLVGRYGARAIVSLDLGDAVEVAFAATRHLDNVHVVRADIHRPPVQRVFDLAFSIGVLHHLPKPQAGFEALVDRVKSGGRIAVWVYGRENNEWIVRYVDPVRTELTSRMSEKWLYWASLPPSMALTGLLWAYRNKSLAERLPYGSYLHYISRFPLREVHSIVFDQLVTPLAHYLPESEVRRWFRGQDFRDLEVGWHNENSWRATAIIEHASEKRARSSSPL